MDIKELLQDSSRRAIEKAAQYVVENPELFPIFIDLAFAEEKKYSQRASRVVYFMSIYEPELIRNYERKIILNLPKLESDNVRGNLLKIYIEIDLPEDEELMGELADICFVYMNEPSERECQRIYSMDILHKVTKIYPEIKNELSLNIEKLYPYNKVAFQSRARRVLKALYKDLGLKMKIPQL